MQLLEIREIKYNSEQNASQVYNVCKKFPPLVVCLPACSLLFNDTEFNSVIFKALYITINMFNFTH